MTDRRSDKPARKRIRRTLRPREFLIVEIERRGLVEVRVPSGAKVRISRKGE